MAQSALSTVDQAGALEQAGGWPEALRDRLSLRDMRRMLQAQEQLVAPALERVAVLRASLPPVGGYEVAVVPTAGLSDPRVMWVVYRAETPEPLVVTTGLLGGTVARLNQRFLDRGTPPPPDSPVQLVRLAAQLMAAAPQARP